MRYRCQKVLKYLIFRLENVTVYFRLKISIRKRIFCFKKEINVIFENCSKCDFYGMRIYLFQYFCQKVCQLLVYHVEIGCVWHLKMSNVPLCAVPLWEAEQNLLIKRDSLSNSELELRVQKTWSSSKFPLPKNSISIQITTFLYRLILIESAKSNKIWRHRDWDELKYFISIILFYNVLDFFHFNPLTTGMAHFWTTCWKKSEIEIEDSDSNMSQLVRSNGVVLPTTQVKKCTMPVVNNRFCTGPKVCHHENFI